MRGFILRMAISALGLWVAASLVPGMSIRGTGTLLAAALLLGFVNAVVRPLLVLLTLPITLVTLGFFLLVINAGMLGLVASLLQGFALAGFLPALLGSVVVSVTGWLASSFVGPTGSYEVLVIEQSHPGGPSTRF